MKIRMFATTMAALFSAAIVVSPAQAMGRNDQSTSSPNSPATYNSNGGDSLNNPTATGSGSSMSHPAAVASPTPSTDAGGAGTSGSGWGSSSSNAPAATTGNQTGVQDPGNANTAQPANSGSSSGY